MESDDRVKYTQWLIKKNVFVVFFQLFFFLSLALVKCLYFQLEFFSLKNCSKLTIIKSRKRCAPYVQQPQRKIDKNRNVLIRCRFFPLYSEFWVFFFSFILYLVFIIVVILIILNIVFWSFGSHTLSYMHIKVIRTFAGVNELHGKSKII